MKSTLSPPRLEISLCSGFPPHLHWIFKCVQCLTFNKALLYRYFPNGSGRCSCYHQWDARKENHVVRAPFNRGMFSLKGRCGFLFHGVTTGAQILKIDSTDSLGNSLLGWIISALCLLPAETWHKRRGSTLRYTSRWLPGDWRRDYFSIFQCSKAACEQKGNEHFSLVVIIIDIYCAIIFTRQHFTRLDSTFLSFSHNPWRWVWYHSHVTEDKGEAQDG